MVAVNRQILMPGNLFAIREICRPGDIPDGRGGHVLMSGGYKGVQENFFILSSAMDQLQVEPLYC